MLAIAIVIFREVLEISLIVSVLLAATRGVPKRAPWVCVGLLVGLAGACLIAIFANAISSAFEGVGQEVMNSVILFTAALLIGWTVLWMSRHGRELTEHFKKVGQEVKTKHKPMYTLAMVVSLAVLREGAEIVMFIYSAIVTGGRIYQLTIGALLGTCAGVAAGVAIYYGLIQIPMRKIFSVTSWLLIFLVGSMVASGFGYLAAAGKVPELVTMVWDTSWLLSESSVLGKVMHVLVGYSERPSGIQLLAFLLTIIGMSVALKVYGRVASDNVKKQLIIIVVGLVCTFGVSQIAYADKHVYSPIVEKGELEIETTGVYDRDHSKEKNAAQEYKNAIGYGVTDRWATELYGEFERLLQENEDGGVNFSSVKFTHLEWENRFQLTEQGQCWLDAGIYFAYEIPVRAKDPGKIEGKVLLEKSTEKFTHTTNLIFSKEVGGGATEQTSAGFAWSSRYRLSKNFQPGVEYWIDFGEIRRKLSYNEQNHQVGPAFYGYLMPHVKYDVGYLFGISKAAPEGELKWILEYELRF